MNPAEEYFIQECVAHARQLPLTKAVLFLRGLLASCQDSQLTGAIHKIFPLLSESDRQLELIQLGQLKLKFDGDKEGK